MTTLNAVPEKHHPTPEERDERVSLPLDAETAIAALLQVDPESEPVEEQENQDQAGARSSGLLRRE